MSISDLHMAYLHMGTHRSTRTFHVRYMKTCILVLCSFYAEKSPSRTLERKKGIIFGFFSALLDEGTHNFYTEFALVVRADPLP